MNYFIILYIIAFLFTSTIYIILYSIKKNELQIKSQRIADTPLVTIRSIKLLATVCVFLFVVFSAPIYDVFFIILIVAFLFCLLGDISIIWNWYIGLIIFLLSHLLFSTAYLVELTNIDVFVFINNGSFITLGIILFLFLCVAGLMYFYLRDKLKERYARSLKINFSLLIYQLGIFLHITTAFFFAQNHFQIQPGIVVVAIGSILFLTSDILLVVREYHHVPKLSVFLTMSTYYGALFLISLVTQFYN
ncbi:MAG: hypothetical protein FK734_11705 [Asgard group archaeon]|nr:hypothetical protein [Asgard group archaeon]